MSDCKNSMLCANHNTHHRSDNAIHHFQYYLICNVRPVDIMNCERRAQYNGVGPLLNAAVNNDSFKAAHRVVEKR